MNDECQWEAIDGLLVFKQSTGTERKHDVVLSLALKTRIKYTVS